MEWRGGMVPHVGFENETGEEGMVQSKENASIRAIPHSWNQFRGPDRDGVIPDQGLPIAWDQKPSPLWKVPCGLGHTSITANENSVFTIEQMDGEECLLSRSIATGKIGWKLPLTIKWDDMMSGTGPRVTPTLHNGKLYALFSNGSLYRVDARSGKTEWQVSTTEKDYEFPDWGISCSPLIWNDTVMVAHGGEKSAARSYSIATGELVWESEFHGEGVYVSPSLLEFFGEKHLIVAVKGKVASLDPKNGKTRWEHPWKIFLNNALIAQPTKIGNDRILLSAGYGKGAECLKISRNRNLYSLSTVWKSKNLKTKFSSPVLKNGFLYGFNENSFSCLNAKTGELQWRGKKYGYGKVFLSDEFLVILGNTGVLSVVEAKPDEFSEVFSGQLLSDARCWNGPALVGGYLLAMNGREIACFDWAKL